MCAIILKSEGDVADLPVSLKLGIDPTATDVSQTTGMLTEEWIRANSGPGKAMAGGPTCNFRGKEVPCFIDCSPKASITSQMLADMLAAIDGLGIYNREEGGPIPFLLLDGHHSPLELPFLEYINNKEHEWMVCIGVPYGTHLWQVGDSSQQNGSFKMWVYKIKGEFILCKETSSFSMTDIVPIVAHSWPHSFGRKEGNLHAIAVRGWGPCNSALLCHADILPTKDEESKDEESKDDESKDDESETAVAAAAAGPRPEEYNLEAPAVQHGLEAILEEAQRRTQLCANVANKRKRKRDKETNLKALKTVAGRVTSGSIVASGMHTVNQCLDAVREKAVQDELEQDRLALRRVALSRKNNRATYDSYQKYKRGEALNGGDLKKLLQHTREAARKDKPASHAANVPELRTWWEERRNRESAIAKLESLTCDPVEEEKESQFDLNLGDESGGDDDDEGRIEEV